MLIKTHGVLVDYHMGNILGKMRVKDSAPLMHVIIPYQLKILRLMQTELN